MGGNDHPKKPSTNWLPGGAPYSLAISCCVAGNSLEDVLNAPGTVYYVDAQGRLYLKRLGRPKRRGVACSGVALTHNQMTHKIGTSYPQNTNLCGLSRHFSHSAHFGPDLPGCSTSRTVISRLLEWSNWPMGIDTLPARCNWVYPWHISVETSLQFFGESFPLAQTLRAESLEESSQKKTAHFTQTWGKFFLSTSAFPRAPVTPSAAACRAPWP